MANLDFVHVDNFNIGSGYLLPAGEYWIGDPVQVLDKDFWNLFLTMSFDSGEDMYCGKDGEHYIAALSTAYGDGLYLDNRFQKFSVDSGMIGMIDTHFLNSSQDLNSGNIFTFDEEVKFCKNNEDTIFINDDWFIITDQEFLVQA